MKGKHLPGTEDRIAAYRQWRWDFRSAYVSDIDQLEWRVIDGKVVPVLLLELTRFDGDNQPGQGYLDAITARFRRGGQGRAAITFAGMLGVDAVIVLFRYNLEDFWLYNLTIGEGWYHLGRDGYRHWLEAKNGRTTEQEKAAAHLRRAGKGQEPAEHLRQ